MRRSTLPAAAFVDPTGGNREAVRELLEAAVDVVVEELTTAADGSPLPADGSAPSAAVPEASRPFASLLGEVGGIVADSATPAHPGYVGHMDPPATVASVVGDLVAAAINNNMLSVELSPVLTRLELELVSAVADAFGFGPAAGGVMAAGGSLANLTALTVARNRGLVGDVHGGGVIGDRRGGSESGDRPVLFASEVAHTSLQKAAMLLGLGTDAVVGVATDDRDRLRPTALRAAIDDAESAGREPFCVVATAGTTTTGSVDPIEAVGEIVAERDLWYHVDAPYGGAVAFSETHRSQLTGLSRADSVTFNP